MAARSTASPLPATTQRWERNMPIEPRPVEQWSQIIATKIPGPFLKTATAVAERVLGDIEGYTHPNSGNETTRKRRQRVKDRDVIELANAMTAFARMFSEAGV